MLQALRFSKHVSISPLVILYMGNFSRQPRHRRCFWFWYWSGLCNIVWNICTELFLMAEVSVCIGLLASLAWHSSALPIRIGGSWHVYVSIWFKLSVVTVEAVSREVALSQTCMVQHVRTETNRCGPTGTVTLEAQSTRAYSLTSSNIRVFFYSRESKRCVGYSFIRCFFFIIYL
jgi:hypothetical protein